MMAGEEIPFLPCPGITQERLREYAEVSGDFNPIHLSDEAARAAGLPGVIAHGMLIAAFIAERALSWGGVGLRVAHIQTRFRAMTRLGDEISVGGRVAGSSPDGFTLELSARNQKAEVTTTSTVVLVTHVV
jgi:acyl dehydratase